MRRRGFALLAVLWIVTVIGVVAMVTSLAGREAAEKAHNRVELTSARWSALGCLEHARAATESALAATRDAAAGEGAWSVVDTLVEKVGYLACDVTAVDVGNAVDLNSTGRQELYNALIALGTERPLVDSLCDALMDWRDSDTTSRPVGAEYSWYLQRGRTPPRDGPLLSRYELALVRGFETSTIRASFDVESGRAVLARAPLSVLASLPGLSAPIALQLIEARTRGIRLSDVSSVAAVLGPADRSALADRVLDLAARIAPEPDAWIVRSTSHGDVALTVEERWVRSGTRVAVMRHEIGR